MGDLFFLIVIVQHPQWRHRLVSNIQLVIWLVIHLVLVIVNVVWDLGPPTLPPRKFIGGPMVENLCDLRVGNIHTWVIHKNKGPILHTIFGGGGG